MSISSNQVTKKSTRAGSFAKLSIHTIPHAKIHCEMLFYDKTMIYHVSFYLTDSDNNAVEVKRFEADFLDKQHKCKHCHSPLWTMHHRANEGNDNKEKQLSCFLQKLPGIDKATAGKMLHQFGVEQQMIKP